MKTTYTLKGSVFSNSTKIFSNDIPVGNFNKSAFSNICYSEINGKKLIFKTKGIFKQYTEIIDSDTKEVIGRIKYNNLHFYANIELYSNSYDWKYEDFFNSKWSISNSNNLETVVDNFINKNSIECVNNNDILVCAGLFALNYYLVTTLTLITCICVIISNTIIVLTN